MANKTYSVVIGDVNGQIAALFGKLTSLHAKQGFAFAIIAGNLFSEVSASTVNDENDVKKLIGGEIEVPLPTYFSLGTRSLPESIVEKLEKDDGELCPNLYLLGRRVSVKTAEGFRIVAVGGKHTQTNHEIMSRFESSYSEADVQALVKDNSSVDLLVTSEWPAAVRDGARASYANTDDAPQGVQSIADLCTALKPRYHFSASPVFYERDPFFHPGEGPRYVTRFISLAPFGNSAKQKWIYAFSLEPSSEPPQALPEGCTASPFTGTKKRKLDSQEQSYSNFRYSNGTTDRYMPDHRKGKRHRRNQPPPTPGQCFFCLSNSACETHMIGSIATDCYVAIAKGPLSTKATFPELGFPGHMLLIPLQHAPTLSLIPDKSVQRSTVIELQRYRDALHKLLAAKSKDNTGRSKLGAVTWEISRAGGVHLHWQFLPVPVDMIQKGLVEAGFKVEAENLGYPRMETDASKVADIEEAGDYLKVMIWSEAVRKELILPIDQTYRFDLQFGRKVLAKLLDLLDRMDWRACAQTETEETSDANAFKEAFKEFDFSLEDD